MRARKEKKQEEEEGEGRTAECGVKIRRFKTEVEETAKKSASEPPEEDALWGEGVM